MTPPSGSAPYAPATAGSTTVLSPIPTVSAPQAAYVQNQFVPYGYQSAQSYPTSNPPSGPSILPPRPSPMAASSAQKAPQPGLPGPAFPHQYSYQDPSLQQQPPPPPQMTQQQMSIPQQHQQSSQPLSQQSHQVQQHQQLGGVQQFPLPSPKSFVTPSLPPMSEQMNQQGPHSQASGPTPSTQSQQQHQQQQKQQQQQQQQSQQFGHTTMPSIAYRPSTEYTHQSSQQYTPTRHAPLLPRPHSPVSGMILQQPAHNTTGSQPSIPNAIALGQQSLPLYSSTSIQNGVYEDPKDPYRYSLRVVQQPIHARMCGFGDKDRRPITPPPCIQLIITDKATGREADISRLDVSFFALTVELWSVDETRNLSIVSTLPVSAASASPFRGQGSRASGLPNTTNASTTVPALANAPPTLTFVAPPIKNLIGSVVATAFKLHDPDGNLGVWFVLQDLSVRTEGEFKLKASFVNLGAPLVSQQSLAATRSIMTPTGALDGQLSDRQQQLIPGSVSESDPSNSQQPVLVVNTGTVRVQATTFSAPFKVYIAKKFPGVIESTSLSKCFAMQGIKIPIRKDQKSGARERERELKREREVGRERDRETRERELAYQQPSR
ncbi:velvet factor-domain-containing protein [Lipomyces oligophaga]|uniref:velvet factor-domain-containing protein n=1 Tax=Lipomyces oligophaga TaxID=45792 RepID=UPI0034CE4965